MNNYQIHYFGLLGERRGLAEESIASPEQTPAGLYAAINAEHRLGMEVSDFRVAVNDEFTPWEHPLHDGDHIAFLPPMSGG
ncbi:MAG: MoaD/ThiS family protein [Luteolibacter sp.]|jgi:molybdopterin converting factor small subunit|nr:MoaD/ThiS family protein [Luteolibacter sp.]